MIQRLLCLIRGSHVDPQRHPLSGFRCSTCNTAGADYDDMGHYGGGYVQTVRARYERMGDAMVRESASTRERLEWSR